jgi:hypothetical protein
MEQQAKAPPEIQKVALFLRSSGAGMKVRVGAMNGKRLDYFKGLLFLPFLSIVLQSLTFFFGQANLQLKLSFHRHTKKQRASVPFPPRKRQRQS